MRGNENKERNELLWYCRDELGIPSTILNVSAQIGEVDTILWMPYGTPLLVEWKQEGEVPRENQTLKHERYRRLGYLVKVFKSFGEARKYVDSLLLELTDARGQFLK